MQIYLIYYNNGSEGYNHRGSTKIPLKHDTEAVGGDLSLDNFMFEFDRQRNPDLPGHNESNVADDLHVS